MTEKLTPERIAELQSAVATFNGFCDQYGETHGIDAYGEASADFDEVLTSMFPDYIDPSVSVVEALTDHIEFLRAELGALKKAGHDLLDARLSTSTGGDMGMVFDASDYAVERTRQGTVTFDGRAVDRFERILRSYTTSREDTKMNDGKMKNWNEFFSRDELTIRDVDLAMGEVFNRQDPDEAKAFVDAYRQITPNAGENLGYLAGYRDPDTMCAMWEFFDVYHPVFGRRRVSYEEAFELGRRWMRDSMQ